MRFFLFVVFSTGIFSGVYAKNFQKSLPDWFFVPSPGEDIGLIGTAHQTAIDPQETAELARIDAIHGFESNFPKYAKSEDLFALIDGKKKVLRIKDGYLRFSDSFFSDDTAIERLVYSKNITPEITASKPIRSCDFKTCSPRWLCSPAQGIRPGILGVSYSAATFRRQLDLARRNAVKLLEYTYGVTVEGKQSVVEFKNSMFSILLSKDSFQINKNFQFKNRNIRLYTKEQCFQNKTLISWMVSSDLPKYYTPDSLSWVNNLVDLEFKAIIGSSAGGFQPLFSSQIRNAYDDAMNKLSKQKGLHNISQSKNSSDHSIVKTGQTHQNTIHPIILGIYLDENKVLKILAIDRENLPNVRTK